MKRFIELRSGFFLALMAILFLVPSVACSGWQNDREYQRALYGATHYTANTSNTSHLYEINTTDGTATLIGDIGFKVDSMASNPVTKRLYAITEGAGSQLIEINRTTGHGTLIATITGPATSVAINCDWNGSSISTVRATLSDYYVQSFIANTNAITKFGTVIGENTPEGQIILSIVPDNGGKPDCTAPLYEGTLVNPTPTSEWYYESGINVPLTIGQKYYLLCDGHDNAGATGNSRIGTSASYPILGEYMRYSNDGGTTWGGVGSPLAIYAEGVSIYSHPTFNSKGELYAYNTDNTLCTINLKTGVATSASGSGVYGRNYGLAFDNNDVLYLLNGTGGNVYTVDKTTGVGTSVGTISGLPHSMAHRGGFDPSTGKYWGLDNTDYYSATRNILVTDVTAFSLSRTIPTLDSMHALAFVAK